MRQLRSFAVGRVILSWQIMPRAIWVLSVPVSPSPSILVRPLLGLSQLSGLLGL
jgi:hypothetical protein